jgi:hypothetical protein
MESNYELMDHILSGSSAEEVSDKIKEILFLKSSEKIDDITPYVAQSLFGFEDSSEYEEE